MLSVGKTTVDNATYRVLEHGVRAVIPHLNKSMTRPGKRTGYEEILFIECMYCKENTKRSPCTKHNSRGELVENCINYRVLNQSSGYKKYVKYAEPEGHHLYSRLHFYKRNKELNIVDIKEDGGLCTNCIILGNETWDKLHTEIWLLYLVTN